MLTIIVVSILSFYFYQSEKENERIEQQSNLKAISKVKCDQIGLWIKQRSNDSEFLSSHRPFHNLLYSYQISHSAADFETIANFLYLFSKNKDYSNIIVINPQNKIIYNLNDSLSLSFQTDSLKIAKKSGKIITTDIYCDTINNSLSIDNYIPVYHNSKLISAIILKTDPYKMLYPMLNDWYVENYTGETLIIKQVEDSILYISPSRFQTISPLSLKISLNEDKLLSHRIIKQDPEVVEGKDYRGVEVLADIRTVGNTGWYLINKIDQKEVYSQITTNLYNNFLIIVGVIVIGGFFLLILEFLIQRKIIKKLYESEKKFKAIFEYSSNAILLLDHEKIIDCNIQAEKLFSLPRKKIIGKHPGELSPAFQPDNKNSIEEAREIINSVLNGEPKHFEWIHCKNGGLIFTDINLSNIELGNKKYLLAFLFDMTDKKKAEEAMRESENKFLSAFKFSPQAMAITSLRDGRLIDVNDIFIKDTGYSYDEIIGHTVEELQFFVNDSERIKYREQVQKDGHIYGMELCFRMKTGAKINCLISSTIISLNSQLHLLTTILNITDRKKAEDELKETKQKLSEVLEHSVNLFYSHGTDQVITYVSPQSKQFLGCTPEEAKTHWTDFITDNPVNLKGIEITRLAIETGEPQPPYELELRKKNGELIWVKVNEAPVIKDGKTVSVVGSLTDISIRKITEEGLRKSERKYKYLFENNPQPMWIYDLATLEFLEVNQAAIMQYGYSRNEFMSMTLQDIRYPEDIDALMNDIKNTSSEFNKAGNWRHKKKNGEVVIVEIISHLIDYDNKAARLVLANDVTEKKKAEEAVKKSEQEYYNLFESANDSIIIFEPDSEIVLEVNKEACNVYGFSKDEFVGKSLKDLTENVKAGEKQIKYILTNQSVINFETRHYTKHGKLLDLLVNASAIEYSGKIAILSINRDITEQKQALNDLEAAYSQLNNLYNSLPEAIFSQDPVNNKMIEVSPAHEQVFGYPPEKFFENPQVWYDLVLPEDRPIVDAGFLTLASGKTHRHQVRIVKPDGTLHWIEATMKPVIDENGKLVRIDGIVSDITERKYSEAALQKSQILLTNALEIAHMGHWEYDVLKDTFTFNDQFYKMFRTSVDEIGSYTMSSADYAKRFVHPDDIKLVGLEIQNAIETAEPDLFRELEHRIIYADGDIGFITVRFNVVKNSEGKTVRTYGVNQDITQRKLTEKALQESENRYRKIFEDHPSVILLINPSTHNIIDANKAASEYYGWQPEKLKRMKISDISTTTVADIQSTINEVVKNQQQRIESKHKLSDGTVRDVVIYISKIELQGKEIIHSIINDITERKKAEDRIKTLTKAVEQSPVSVVITNPKGNIQYVNKKFSVITGYGLDEVLNENPKILKSGSQSADFYKELWDSILSGKVWQGELHNKKKNGELYWENVIISPIVNEMGIITNFVAVKEDITEKKKMIEELIEAKEKAEVASMIKSNFLANMSHELRTPLVGILGFAELLVSETTESNHAEMSNTILKSGKRLMDTLNSILDISRIEANKHEIKQTDFSLMEIISESTELFKQAVKDKELYMKVNLQSGQVILHSDKDLLIKVFNNLISNAVKYTHKGGITVAAYKISDNYVTVDVTDTGIGISSEFQKVIFEPFRQVSEGYARRYEGTGLGLSITKRFIELLNGSITLNSIPGEGSTFSVTLPVITTKCYKQSHVKEKLESINSGFTNVSGKSDVLLVEDDITNASVICAYLKDYASVDHVIDGYKAIDYCKAKNYNVVLMDINLKGINGIETMEQIRTINEHCAHLPVIAVTAYAMSGDREKFLSYGFSHYLSKPFQRSELLNLLSYIFNK